GANVAIFARDEAAARKAIDELEAKYEGKFSFYKTDVSDMKSCRESVDAFYNDAGSIDILVNNAGVGPAGRFIDMDEELTDWFNCFNIDLHGGARMCYSVLKHMKEQKSGHIVNITSNAGEIINKPFLTAYAVSKAAFNHFTRALAAEVAPYGIRVNAIAPGFTFSNFVANMPEEVYKELCADIPVGRFAQPFEIGALAAYLAGDVSDIVTGAVITADGGYVLQH
ncbi:MAG: SDR family oxidoreductase, partial [Oscillospiraceae bacterium]|nr:SDR family oxidoreductase [Oscillospiraceae bacterium]